MMGFWSGFGIGSIFGGCAGLIVFALMNAAKVGDYQIERMFENEQSIGKVEK